MRAGRVALALLLAGCFPDADKLRGGGTPGNGGTGMGGSGGTSGTGGTAGQGGAGGGNMDGGGPPAGTRAEACAALGNAIAAQLMRCNPYLLMAGYGSQAAYAQRLTLNCNLYDAPGVNWPARPFKPCADALAAQSCTDWFDDVPLAACPLNGQFLDGQPCGSGFQCQTGLCSFPATGCGRCIQRPLMGQACVETCAQNLSCSPNKVCVPLGVRGAPCDANTPCRPSLACHNGACAPPATSGTCVTDDECDFTQGYVCNPDRGQCVKVTFGPTCLLNPDGSYVYCSGAQICKQGMCIARVADGGACSDTDRLFCQWPARCSNMRCRLPAPDRTCMPMATAGSGLPAGPGVGPTTRISDARAFGRPERVVRP
jgi:hypothetical protein